MEFVERLLPPSHKFVQIICTCSIAEPYVPAQQQLDFLEDLEETPTKVKGKIKKKGRFKSGTSSDSDVYDGSARHGAGDDTDDTTESMDVVEDAPLAPALPKKKPRNLSAPFSATSILHGSQECGLCGHVHGPGVCSMMSSSSNLLEYREILLNHAVDEPWESRVRIDINPMFFERHIEETRTESRYRGYRTSIIRSRPRSSVGWSTSQTGLHNRIYFDDCEDERVKQTRSVASDAALQAHVFAWHSA